MRQSTVVAIGGGIIQDIATFTAHIFYRGIKWIHVPTTLLAMSDSCIGAKCGINFGAFKNQLGVFHSPTRVLICHKFLDTLFDKDIRSGYGEILKLLLTGSPELFANLQKRLDESGFRNPELPALIYQCLNVKKGVIEADEYETDLRRILNYGHTFGHALEAVTEYEVPHGLAVAWGIDLANFISLRCDLLKEADFRSIHDFVARHFSFRVSRLVSAAELIQGARRDKKVSAGKLNLILLDRPGSLQIVPSAFDATLEANVAEYLGKHNVIHCH
jgi:3-dehydroquinate synthase